MSQKVGGVIKFKNRCKVCGYDFEYTRDDIEEDGKIECPLCSSRCTHSMITAYFDNDTGTFGDFSPEINDVTWSSDQQRQIMEQTTELKQCRYCNADRLYSVRCDCIILAEHMKLEFAELLCDRK